ncbi:IS66 family transposase [Providencia rettgeri]|uniref:IS66 family transposase n=1 Tax=Providencia rettgeri TaxID=587 RepID=UPI0023AB2F3A|nr:IS66 family transposase [Providencia rettgeri]
MKTIAQLQQQNAELKALLIQKDLEIAQKEARIAYLHEQFILARQKQFGPSAEHFAEQGDLFNEAEAIADDEASEPEKQAISYTRHKPARKSLPKDLPREQIIHDIENKMCGDCGHELHQMGEDKSEKLEFIPAQIKVIEHIRPKYSCRHCEKHGIAVQIQQAHLPAMPIEKGIATASLLSHLITYKYQYGLPLYRQESMFKQYGIELSRKTMSDWVLKSAQLLTPLYEKLTQVLLAQGILHADETVVNVVKSDKTNHYMWVYCSGTDTIHPNNSQPNIVLFDYQPSRSARCVVDYLSGYSGYLQVDGYQAYEKTAATLVGCWAHARRKFMEAKKVQGKHKTGKADVVLTLIQKLYAVEAEIKDKSPPDKFAVRQVRSQPILETLRQWLEKKQSTVVGNSKLIEAIHYLANQWPKLIVYMRDGRLNIDNNRAERAIKPFVIGRKAWLFSQTANGATASAILYSIVETAKANGLVPFEYLTVCLGELSQPTYDIERLLPWNIKRW